MKLFLLFFIKTLLNSEKKNSPFCWIINPTTSFQADCKSAGTSIFECHRQAQTPKENKSNDVAEIVLIISEVSTSSTSEDKKI